MFKENVLLTHRHLVQSRVVCLSRNWYLCTVNKNTIFSIAGEAAFNDAALAVFHHQSKNCAVYKNFIKHLNIAPAEVTSISAIPFLPVEFFKDQTVITGNKPAEITFTSSGTTGMVTSSHLVTDIGWYITSFRKAFEIFYGDVKDYTILALLPSYLERKGSSLVFMADDLIKRSTNPDSGFYLYNHREFYVQLKKQQTTKKKTLLLGVTFALLDFIEQYQLHFPELIVMETGGMKGRRKELIRDELHRQLCNGFGINSIHSEYGMTELLSQAYSKGNGIFNCPPWMKVLIRDVNDPLTVLGTNKTGGVNVIDLANINSCSFIATQDLGRILTDSSFKILGRFDNADIRGCSLLVA